MSLSPCIAMDPLAPSPVAVVRQVAERPSGRRRTCRLLQKGRQQVQDIWKGRHKLSHHLAPSLWPHSWPVASSFLEGSTSPVVLRLIPSSERAVCHTLGHRIARKSQPQPCLWVQSSVTVLNHTLSGRSEWQTAAVSLSQ